MSCPSIPECSDGAPSGPLRCVCCGKELRITCGNEGCPPPLPASNQVRTRSSDVRPRLFASRQCARCTRAFVPTGPNSRYCKRDDCATYRAALPECS